MTALKDTISAKGFKIGRPRALHERKARELIERIASGRVLRDVCSDDDMPDRTAVWRLMDSDDSFRNMITRARAESAHALAEEVITIADAATPETVHVAARRCEQRKWLAGRYNSMYADDKGKTEVNVSLTWERLIEQSLQVDPPTIEHEPKKG